MFGPEVEAVYVIFVEDEWDICTVSSEAARVAEEALLEIYTLSPSCFEPQVGPNGVKRESRL